MSCVLGTNTSIKDLGLLLMQSVLTRQYYVTNFTSLVLSDMSPNLQAIEGSGAWFPLSITIFQTMQDRFKPYIRR